MNRQDETLESRRAAKSGTTSNAKIITRLLVLTTAMFGFGYALVPMYDLFCDAFGLNGRTGVVDAQTAARDVVDTTRTVTVQFTSHTANGLPWEFRPGVASMTVHPGEVINTAYFARNKGSRPIAGRATYSVAPARAAVHFKKTECFCFSNQILNGGESKDMQVRFLVESQLPADVKTITLSYSFFNAEKYLSDDERSKLSARVDDGATPTVSNNI